MADISQNIEYMAQVLRVVGYPVGPGHIPGQPDKPFVEAYTKALPVIWNMVTDQQGPGVNSMTPQQFDVFKTNFGQRITPDKIAAIKAYADGASYGGLKGEYLKGAIQFTESNVTDSMLANAKGFVAILEKPQGMLESLRAIETARNPDAWGVKPDAPRAMRVSTGGLSSPVHKPSTPSAGAGNPVGQVIGPSGKSWGIQAPASAGAPPAATKVANAPAGAQAPGPASTPAATPAPAEKSPLDQAAFQVKLFLASISNSINERTAKLKKEGGLFGTVLMQATEIPGPGELKGEFGQDARRSLQGVLKTFQPQLELSDDEIYNYAPAVGEKIKKNFPALAQNMTAEQKEKINKQGGIQGLVDSLNLLHQNKQLPGGKLYEGGPPVQLTGMGVTILNWAFKFVSRIFPGAAPMMNDLLRNFSGGLGYSELVPQDKKDPGISKMLGDTRPGMSETERLQATYKKAFAEAKEAAGPDAKPEEVQKKLHETLDKGVSVMMNLPFGDEESRKRYKEALDKGLEQAAKGQTTEEASHAFALYFTSSWNKNDHALKVGAHESPKVSEHLRDFNVDGHNIDHISGAYNKLSKAEAHANYPQRPIVFKDEAGTKFIAGLTAENIFTVEKVTPEMEAALDRAAANPDQQAAKAELIKLSKADDKMTGLAVLVGGYNDVSLASLQRDVTNAPRFGVLKDVIDKRYNDAAGPERAAPRAGTPRATARRGAPSESGLMQPDMVTANRAIGEENMQRYGATMAPVFQEADYKKSGRIGVLVLEDRNGLMQKRDQEYNGNLSRALRHEEYFAHYDITSEYNRFMDGFTKFRNDNAEHMKNWSTARQMAKYEEDYKFRGGSFEKDFPEMAKATKAYPRSHMNYVPGLVVSIYNKMEMLERTAPKQQKGFLQRLFDGESSPPARSPSVEPVQSNSPPEQEVRSPRPVTPPPPDPAVQKAVDQQEMFPNTVKSVRQQEFCDNGCEMTGYNPGVDSQGGGPAFQNSRASLGMRPGA
jgi:hypothetical protein